MTNFRLQSQDAADSQSSTTEHKSSTCTEQSATQSQQTSAHTGTYELPSRTAASLPQFASGSDVLKAEVIWTMKTVSDHLSFKSNDNINEVFKEMFPDSQIASKFTCGEKKTAYLAVFGLAPYLRDKLITTVNANSTPFTVMFDESLNNKSQSKQLDVHVRYWATDNTVKSSYLTSEFMGHATATDIMDHFDSSVFESGLNMENLVQVGMDGPNVNWCFFDKLKQKMNDDYDQGLINIGSCGLHTTHNAFKAGIKDFGWNVDDFLSSLYYLLKDVPARKDDYLQASSNAQMPLKFCQHRWLDSLSSCQRAMDILPNADH